jgi:hypothetical protein
MCLIWISLLANDKKTGNIYHRFVSPGMRPNFGSKIRA